MHQVWLTVMVTELRSDSLGGEGLVL